MRERAVDEHVSRVKKHVRARAEAVILHEGA